MDFAIFVFCAAEIIVGLAMCIADCFDGSKKLSPNYIEACKEIIHIHIEEIAKPLFQWGSIFMKIIVIFQTIINTIMTLIFFTVGRTIKYVVIFVYFVLKFTFLAIFKSHKS